MGLETYGEFEVDLRRGGRGAIPREDLLTAGGNLQGYVGRKLMPALGLGTSYFL